MNGSQFQGNYRNPYIIGSAIDEPEKFFGRESLFQFIEDNLKQNVKLILLHGQRRIGKSSVLQQIPNFVGSDEFFFVNFDIQNKDKLPLNSILHELVQAIVEHLSYYDLPYSDDLKVPSSENLGYDQDIFFDEFLPEVYKRLRNKKLVLLLDEFDVLHNNHHTAEEESLFSYIKSFYKKDDNLFIIPVVGRYPDDLPKM
ncbi:MAG: ATP-binding protein, partial [Okeania sp. SIO2C9]|uniref:ATP-binding protein n=1 Tax=Okeania sp. SIO2C9 TaxID=2607791 RepID=UPI0013BF8D7B